MKNILITVLVLVFVASCASNSSNSKVKNIEVSHNAKVVLADKDSEEKVICKQIKKTGSHRITTVCQAASDIEDRRKTTQRELQRRTLRSGPSGTGSAGN